MEDKRLDLKVLILLWILLIIAIIPTFAHFGNFLYDSGREAYYPTQILAGKILYKDIANVYGPFAYLYNAILYKIFGAHLNVLYFSGCICAFCIVSLTYLISRLYLSRILCFSLAFFAIAVGILNCSLFNFVFPYSFSMIYGLVCFLFSVWFLLNYQKTPQKTYLLYLSSLFAGIAIANKYEFWAYSIVILYSMFKIKRLSINESLITLSSMCAATVSCFAILFLQGLTINDLLISADIVKKTALSEAMKYYGLSHGNFPAKWSLVSMLKHSTETLSTFFLLIFGSKIVYSDNLLKKISGVILIFISITLFVSFAHPELFIFLPPLLLLIYFAKIKQITSDDKFFLLFFSAIMLNLKNFFGLIPLTYGVFYISFILLTVLALAIKFFKPLKNCEKIISLFVIISAFVFIYTNLEFTTGNFHSKNYPLKTEKGVFYLDEPGVKIIEDLVDYINKTTTPSDKVVVLPEGFFINFLTDRAFDNSFLTLTPVTFEVYGENAIIERFKSVKPEIIVIHDNPTSLDFKYNNICKDYGIQLCEYIGKNYKYEKVFGVDNFNFYLYRYINLAP